MLAPDENRPARWCGLEAELAEIDAAGLRRALRLAARAGGRLPRAGGTPILNFSSNDYLDLANDPALAQAAAQAAATQGSGAGASRLMAGHLPAHDGLERQLAAWCGQEAALVFPSGYQANVGVLGALAGRDDVIFSDALNHASIIDGARLSRAAVHVYRHGDTAQLETLLARCDARRRIIVTDALFSMDGDVAPLRELRTLADRYDAFLLVDEAHALGVYGEGRGLCAEVGIQPDVTIGTMSKALGSGGGFIASAAPLRELVLNRARSFIYTTGLSPLCAAAAAAALTRIAEQPRLGAALLARAAHLRASLAAAGVPTLPGGSQIIPVPIGDNCAARDAAHALHEMGLWVTAIRPPTVAPGTARLRLSVTLAHTPFDVEHLARALARAIPRESASCAAYS